MTSGNQFNKGTDYNSEIIIRLIFCNFQQLLSCVCICISVFEKSATYSTCIIQYRVTYELSYGLPGASHRVDYSDYNRRD